MVPVRFSVDFRKPLAAFAKHVQADQFSGRPPERVVFHLNPDLRQCLDLMEEVSVGLAAIEFSIWVEDSLALISVSKSV